MRVPVSTTSPAHVTVTDVFVNTTSQSESHNCPMEIRENSLRAGTRCTLRAAAGRVGIFSSATCVECMTSPLAAVMRIGGVAGRTFTTGAFAVQKCEVQPLSAIAGCGVGVGIDKGGPIILDTGKHILDVLGTVSLVLVGSPRDQLAVGAAGAVPEECRVLEM